MWSLFSLVFICLCGIGTGAFIPQGKKLNGTLPIGSRTNANCNVQWTFGLDCVEFRINLIKQLNKWHGPDNCGPRMDTRQTAESTQDCMYQLISSDGSSIEGIHTSVDGKIVDYFTFNLTGREYGCEVNSESHSTDPTELTDNGRNYCNMWNLMAGSGMTSVPKFSRDSSNERCTQFTTADCTWF